MQDESIAPTQTTTICLKLLFHFLKRRKKSLQALRLWLLGRNILDVDGSGWFYLDELQELSGIEPDYMIRLINNSMLFTRVSRGRCFYLSQMKILKRCRVMYGTLRGQKITKRFMKLLSSLRLFRSYIIRCYLELDRNKKKCRQYTVGRISYEDVAQYFGISRQSVIDLIYLSGAKPYKNIAVISPRVRVDIKHWKQFGNWQLNNMNLVINGYRMSDNLRSYFVRKDDLGYYLCQRRPNIFKFSGTFLVRNKGQRK